MSSPSAGGGRGGGGVGQVKVGLAAWAGMGEILRCAAEVLVLWVILMQRWLF